MDERKEEGGSCSVNRGPKAHMKIIVSLRETIRIMGEIDKAIPAWPLK